MDTQTISLITNFFMQNPQSVVGLILPPVIDMLNRDIPKDREVERFLATFAICFLVAVVFDFNKILVNSWGDVVASFALIFTESQVIYSLYFKNSFLRDKMLERIYSGNLAPTTSPSKPSTSPSVSPSSSEVG